jgi:hypothetical protein
MVMKNAPFKPTERFYAIAPYSESVSAEVFELDAADFR